MHAGYELPLSIEVKLLVHDQVDIVCELLEILLLLMNLNLLKVLISQLHDSLRHFDEAVRAATLSDASTRVISPFVALSSAFCGVAGVLRLPI